MANINKIRVSGTTYNIEDSNASKTVELTQAQYDALITKDPNTYYIISDATPIDITDYYTKSEVDNAITAATSTKQDTLVSSENIKTINNESLLGSGNITIQGGGGSTYTAGDGIDITNDVISVTGKADTSAVTSVSDSLTAHTANTTVHVTAADKTAWNAKSDFSGDYNDLTNKLSAGTNVTIVDNVISAEGGGSITIDPSLDTGSTNAVANSAITTAINAKASQDKAYGSTTWGESNNKEYVQFTTVSGIRDSARYISKINGKTVWGTTNINACKNWELVETSAITTSVTSSSTDAQVPSAKAVNDKLGGLSLVKLTQAEYDALATKDNSILYVIVN